MFALGAIGRFARVHAGATWTSRTTSAPWAARQLHTSVVDAAGAIYVLGGNNINGGGCFHDVWATTDGGARPDSVKVGWSGGTTGVLSGLYEGLRGTWGYYGGIEGVLREYLGVSRGTRRVLAGGVRAGWLRGTLGGT